MNVCPCTCQSGILPASVTLSELSVSLKNLVCCVRSVQIRIEIGNGGVLPIWKVKSNVSFEHRPFVREKHKINQTSSEFV